MNNDGPPLHIIRIFFMIRIGMSESYFFVLACSSKYPAPVTSWLSGHVLAR